MSYSSGAVPQSYSPDQAAAVVAGLAASPLIIPPIFALRDQQHGATVTTSIGSVDIASQDAEPTKPADKQVTSSTYGIVIPISMGKRRLAGNVVYSSDITSEMVGTYDYYVDYQVPVTTTIATNFDDWPNVDFSTWPDANGNLFGVFNEIDSGTTLVRVYQNNDDTSDNWVDVQRYTFITLTDSVGNAQTFRFTLTD